MVYPTFCFPLSYLAALFIIQRRQHSPLREGMIWSSHKKGNYFFLRQEDFLFSIVACIFLSPSSDYFVANNLWSIKISWRPEVCGSARFGFKVILEFEWTLVMQEGVTRLPFQKRTSQELLFNNIARCNTILSIYISQILYENSINMCHH